MMPDPVGDIRPVPDPTRLTTENLKREIARVERDFGIQIDKLKEFHELDIRRLIELANRTITGVEAKIDCVEEKLEEKLRAVALQFELVERQRVESKADNQSARDAALTAMKESLNSLGTTYNSAHAALVSLVDDLKGRITSLEAMRMGSKETNASFYAWGGIILTVIWIAIAILSYMHK